MQTCSFNRKRGSILQFLFSAFLTICLLIPSQAQLQGDVNGDDCVDDLDLLIVLFDFGMNQDRRADVNRDGSVDDLDLLIVLFQFGECRPNIIWKLNFESLPPSSPVMIQTTQGPRTSQISGGTMELKMGEPMDNGQIPIEIVAMSLGTRSVQIVPTQPTGGMAILQDFEAPSGGMWDPLTGQFNMVVPMRMTYWLLNEIYPIGMRGELDDDVEATFAQCIVTLNGHAFLTGPNNNVLHVEGSLNCQVVEPEFVGPVFNVSVPVSADVQRKDPLDACPTKTVNKRKVCIQPVFIGTGPDDANATGASYAVFKAEAEAIWGKACIEFQWQAPIYINNNAYKILEGMGDSMTAEERALIREVDPRGDNDCIEVFFVSRMLNANGQKHESGDGYTVHSGGQQAKIVVADDAVTDCDPDSDRVLAHELGHALGNLDHDTDTCMKPTGNPPNCPGRNPDKVTTTQARKLTNPVIKPKDPKERCCLTTSD